MNSRAQSETIGVILLVGVVTLAISTFGVYYLGSIDQNPGPTTNVDSHVTAEEIRLTHDGGDIVDTANLRVVVRANGADTGIDWSEGSLSGSTPDSFGPGETWSVDVSAARDDASGSDFDPDTEVRILLVHDPTNSVVYDTVTSPDSS
ncbi:Protein of unknown function [Halogranum gelatinilyticum]|uniref:Archaeal Type IV pilin N-terminal domain-containing protein n=1 Tax=Halogranum gelatinilyticum TaxID=660521 RepID=A0A1G9TN03_9EURY|nr:type IV pilin N-terminal domain-containing protein [Halogranum gelatinilyticum]SDM49146.1 Protein of unknown function [Halogranum gelatinilyticum]